MSDDIIARAEAALEGRWPGARIASPTRFFGSLVRELVAELKTTRAQLRQVARQLELFLEDGERNRVIVALAITDGKPEGNENV